MEDGQYIGTESSHLTSTTLVLKQYKGKNEKWVVLLDT
jgi:hypothetical protein